MPVWEFVCESTGCLERFELTKRFTDLPEGTCPRCGSKARKLLSVPGIVFKGTGWYKTDSRTTPSEGSSSTGSSGSSTSPATEGASPAPGATGSESKSAAASGESAKASGTSSGSSGANVST
ncbi:MAG: FmdB family transcriptional regulator [Chloroflexota bacterium]|nr:MAG: FmdB family transcriptional regulator [Chloroflexota bacterium]